MARTINADALLKSIAANTATTEELEQGMALLKAVEAAEAGTPNDEQVTLLKAAGLIEEDAPETPDAAAAPAAPPAAQPEAVQKALDALEDGPSDLPEAGALLEEIARQGGADLAKSMDVAPVLQAQVVTSDRLCKAVEDLTVVVLAQNNLIAQMAPAVAEVADIKKSLAGLQDSLQKSLPGSAGNGSTELASALGQALARIANVETTLNHTPFAGNPSRSGAMLKSVQNGAGGDITMPKAMDVIQKSHLPDYEKSEALGTLQHAVSTGRPFTDVLNSYGLLAQAATQN